MEIVSKAKKLRDLLREQGFAGLRAKIADKLRDRAEERQYGQYVLRNKITEVERDRIRRRAATLSHRPLISILLPTYNTDARLLRLCIGSVIDQLYPNWELCIADDASSASHISGILEEYAARDDRIKVVYREKNGHISAASNSALELATGDFVVLLDHDDELSEDALFWVASEINEHPEVELIYSDEDLIDASGRHSRPRFKPDWSADLFLSLNLLNHLVAVRTETLRKIGGFPLGFEGSQDYDLELRVIEQAYESAIRHIPRILYHWRAVPGSVALAASEKSYAHERARTAIREHLERTDRKADVSEGQYGLHRVRFQLPEKLPKITLVFTEDDPAETYLRVAEILSQTDYSDVGALIITGSKESMSKRSDIVYLAADAITTAEKLNFGAHHADSDILCFADLNFRPLSPDWCGEMVSWTIQDRVGAVGAKLLYKNWTVMHGGLINGVDGVVGVAHQGIGREALGNMFRNRFPGNFSATSACFMVLRKTVFEEIGGFDAQNFPEHLFDADMCLQIRRSGRRIVVNPYAELIQTSDRVPRILSEKPTTSELQHFAKKWPEHLISDPFYNPNLSKKCADFSIDI